MSDNVTPIGKAKERKAKEPKPPRQQQPPPAYSWWGELRTTEAGRPKATLGNAIVFLRNEQAYAGALRWNEMAGVAELAEEEISDPNVTAIRAHLERSFDVAFSETDIHRAVELVAHEQPYHPVRKYLSGLVWDGTVRIPWLLAEVLHAEVTPLHEVYLRRFLVSAVARAMKPGCKVDTVLILQGDQGAGKSTFFRELGSPWFSDTEMDLGSKDAYLMLGRSWLVEWGELNTLSRSTQERVKAFLSASEDIFRQPYGRTMTRLPRTAVIVGSTNKEEILHDETGSRRFWVLPVRGLVEVELLRQWRDQIWAEARVLYDQGEPWWLSREEDDQRAVLAETYEVADVWTNAVLKWVRGKGSAPVTTANVLDALEVKAAQQGRFEQMRVATILRKNGWIQERRMVEGVRQRLWVRPDSLALSAQPDQPNERGSGSTFFSDFDQLPYLPNLPNLFTH